MLTSERVDGRVLLTKLRFSEFVVCVYYRYKINMPLLINFLRKLPISGLRGVVVQGLINSVPTVGFSSNYEIRHIPPIFIIPQSFSSLRSLRAEKWLRETRDDE